MPRGPVGWGLSALSLQVLILKVISMSSNEENLALCQSDKTERGDHLWVTLTARQAEILGDGVSWSPEGVTGFEVCGLCGAMRTLGADGSVESPEPITYFAPSRMSRFWSLARYWHHGYSRGENAAQYVVEELDFEEARDEAFESELRSRDFSPFEFFAKSCNDRPDADDCWEVYGEGVCDGVDEALGEDPSELSKSFNILEQEGLLQLLS